MKKVNTKTICNYTGVNLLIKKHKDLGILTHSYDDIYAVIQLPVNLTFDILKKHILNISIVTDAVSPNVELNVENMLCILSEMYGIRCLKVFKKKFGDNQRIYSSTDTAVIDYFWLWESSAVTVNPEDYSTVNSYIRKKVLQLLSP